MRWWPLPRLRAPPPEGNEQGDNQETDKGDEPDDPNEEDQQDDSVLSFINQAEQGKVTRDHHRQFTPPASPDIPTDDHRVRSILSEGAKTFVPPEAREFRNVTYQSRINTEIITNLTETGIIEQGHVRSTYRLFTIPKNDGRARVLYDLSQLTPFLTKPTCRLPRPFDVLANGNARFAIKVDVAAGEHFCC